MPWLAEPFILAAQKAHQVSQAPPPPWWVWVLACAIMAAVIAVVARLENPK